MHSLSSLSVPLSGHISLVEGPSSADLIDERVPQLRTHRPKSRLFLTVCPLMQDMVLSTSRIERDAVIRLTVDPDVSRLWAQPGKFLLNIDGQLVTLRPNLRVHRQNGAVEFLHVTPEHSRTTTGRLLLDPAIQKAISRQGFTARAWPAREILAEPMMSTARRIVGASGVPPTPRERQVLRYLFSQSHNIDAHEVIRKLGSELRFLAALLYRSARIDVTQEITPNTIVYPYLFGEKK